ncbi:hypothetical protein GCM10027184_26310 [Saccharothrix stipae]
MTPLLPGGGTCTVLITSRHKLPGLITANGARHVPSDVLTEQESRALLTRRLGVHRATAEPAATSDLIRSCGGFPPALGIVAAHARTRPGTSPTARRTPGAPWATSPTGPVGTTRRSTATGVP